MDDGATWTQIEDHLASQAGKAAVVKALRAFDAALEKDVAAFNRVHASAGMAITSRTRAARKTRRAARLSPDGPRGRFSGTKKRTPAYPPAGTFFAAFGEADGLSSSSTIHPAPCTSRATVSANLMSVLRARPAVSL